MQLGGPGGERLHQREIQTVRVRVKRRAGAAVLDEAREVVHGVIPTVTLVRNISLQQGEHAGRAILACVFKGSRHGRDVRERDCFSEVATDFQLRIHPWLESAIDLEEERLPDPEGRVAALSRGGTHGQLGCGVCAQPCIHPRGPEA